MPDPRTNKHAVAPTRAYSGVLEPGNGGRYEYCVWQTYDGQWYAAFPDYGRSSRIGAGRHHTDYVQEKFRCSRPDAIIMTEIINSCIFQATNAKDPGSPGALADFISQVVNG